MRVPRNYRWVAMALAVSLPGLGWLLLSLVGEREQDFQRRLALWGGRSQPILDPSHPLFSLRPILGDRSYQAVAGSLGRLVEAEGSKANREQLAELLEVQPIRVVMAGGARALGGDWVEGIEAPSLVEVLILDDTAVTDRSTGKFLAMRNLEVLGLVDTAVGDSAVDRLRLLPRLRYLYVGGPNIRALRLLEARVVDESGVPAVRAGSRHRVEGRIRVDGLSSRPRYVLGRYRSEGAPPVWSLASRHPQARVGDLGKLEEQAPGLWTFRVDLPRLPSGRSTIEVSVVPEEGGKGTQVFYRLPTIEIDLGSPIPTGTLPVGPE